MTREQAAETAIKAALAAAALDGTDAEGNAYTVALRCSLIDDDPDSLRDDSAYPLAYVSSDIAYSEETDGDCPWVVPVQIAFATINSLDTKKQTALAIYEAGRNAVEKNDAADWTAFNPAGYAIDALIVEPGGEISTTDEGTKLNVFAFPATVHLRGA